MAETMTMTGEEKLLALEEIRALKARYFRFVDMKDWASFSELFTEDAELHPAGGATPSSGGGRPPSIVGIAAIVDWVRNGLEGAVTVHHGFMPEISLTSASTATGIWAMEDRLEWSDRAIHGFGHYFDDYVRVNGMWRIASSRLTRLKMVVIPTGAA